ncbi:MAG TPA: hypothetical protein VMT04_08315 [Terriglobales bacterium]|nr:hypothetical protein [Terriglobales bacterium]
MKLGLLIDIFLPLAGFFLTVYLRDKLIQVQPLKNLELFFYILLAVSLSEVGAIFILKKRFSSNLVQKSTGQCFSLAKENPNASIQQFAERNLLSFAIIIFTFCFSPTIYGFIYYLFGGTWERFALFVAITFLFFQLFKPKMEELEKLSTRLDSGS